MIAVHNRDFMQSFYRERVMLFLLERWFSNRCCFLAVCTEDVNRLCYDSIVCYAMPTLKFCLFENIRFSYATFLRGNVLTCRRPTRQYMPWSDPNMTHGLRYADSLELDLTGLKLFWDGEAAAFLPITYQASSHFYISIVGWILAVSHYS